ncbi:MAG TPA: type IV pilus assembly protein PilM [Solirubrobacteraceae bacterium]|nr:type IV pilus assembly protein PilM [Solirubrobacteraceae bacterium]
MPSPSKPKLARLKLARPKLVKPKLVKPKLVRPALKPSLGRRSGASLVGLDIQPGHVAAVQARVNGTITAERAAALPLPADTVREGEVLDEGALGVTLRELFDGSGLSRRVRVGVANQRVVLRTLELPPVTDRKELAAAVRFQAQDQVPMPLSNAVLDFQPLGVIETPAGPRQQVVLVAAQRDMVERLLVAVRNAGLRPEGVDLSAFALIRSLYRPDPEHDGRVLYLNVDGLTNMAIAEGAVCRFTRVVGGGLEAMAGELAERHGVAVDDARALIAVANLSAPDAVEQQLRVVLDNGIREIAGEVRNSLDFHRSQENGGEVSRVVLSGAALDIPGFADALQAELGMPLAHATVDFAGETASVSPQRLAIAAGLAVEEAPR